MSEEENKPKESMKDLLAELELTAKQLEQELVDINDQIEELHQTYRSKHANLYFIKGFLEEEDDA